MRRCIVLVLLVFLLSSCSSAAATPISSGFRCRMTAEVDTMAISALLDRTDPSQTVISFEKPEALKGLHMIIGDGTVCAKYGGLSFDIPSTYEKEKILVVALAEAFDALGAQNGQYDTCFVFDETTGVPISFAVEDQNATIFFTDWEVLTDDQVSV